MKKIAHDRLRALVQRMFEAAGCRPAEAGRVAHSLVEANLVGHDSHGVIRVASYLDWLRTGKVVANREPLIVFENDAIAIVDGQFGFGQVMGEAAMRLAIAKSTRHGVAAVALRNSGHLGRIGDWAELAAAAGKLSLHFVNTTGGGLLVAPVGGISRRLSANPIAAAVPTQGGPPILLDMSACTVAEGKIRVALNKGVSLPDGCIIDSRGRPTNDPKTFYGPPAGSILPVGGHKGYALSFLIELLAGALTGGSCSAPGVDRVVNGMLTIVLDPSFFQVEDAFFAEVRRYIEFVKSSERIDPAVEILVPGEPEERTRERRQREGVELDDTTWRQLVEAGRGVGVDAEQST